LYRVNVEREIAPIASIASAAFVIVVTPSVSNGSGAHRLPDRDTGDETLTDIAIAITSASQRSTAYDRLGGFAAGSGRPPH